MERFSISGSDVIRDSQNLSQITPTLGHVSTDGSLSSSLASRCASNASLDITLGSDYLNELIREKFNDATVIVSVVILVLINFIVIAGNVLVIVAVFATPKLRTVTNFFIVSLAVADLLVGIAVLPYSLTLEILDTWIFGEIWCQGWLVTDVWLCTASIDRYLAVTRPVQYRSMMTAKRAKFIILAVWIVSFIICFPMLIVRNTQQREATTRNELGLRMQRISTPSFAQLPLGFNSSNRNRSKASIAQLIEPTASGRILNFQQSSSLKRKRSSTSFPTFTSPSHSSATLHRFSSPPHTSRLHASRHLFYSSNQISPLTVIVFNGAYSTQQASDRKTNPPIVTQQQSANKRNRTNHSKRSVPNILPEEYSLNDVLSSDLPPISVSGSTIPMKSFNPQSSRVLTTNGDNCAPRPVQCDLFTDKTYVIYSALGSFFIPMFVMIFFYWRIYLVAIRTTRALKCGYRTTKGGSTGGGSEGGTEERLTLRIHRGNDNELQKSASYRVGKTSSDVSVHHLQKPGGHSLMPSKSSNTLSPNDVCVETNGKNRRNSPGCHSLLSLPSSSSQSTSRESSAKGNKAALARLSKRTSKYQAKRFHAETKAAKTVGIIVGGFIVCWLPFFTVYLMRAFCEDCIPELLFSIFFWLGYCNSMINPCIYGLFSRDFRRAFKNIICRCRLREETSVSSLIRQIHMPTFFEEDMPEEAEKPESQEY